LEEKLNGDRQEGGQKEESKGEHDWRKGGDGANGHAAQYKSDKDLM
jgi:hypothetical protein